MRTLKGLLFFGEITGTAKKLRSAVRLARKIPRENQSPRFSKHQTTWFVKKGNDAWNEMLVQEFLRLLFPHQPKTRYFENDLDSDEDPDIDNETAPGLPISFSGVASKQVPGFCLVSEIKRKALYEGLLSGKYTNFGALLIACLFLNEDDLKFEDLCVNDKNQVIKLDGEWCLVSEIMFDRINGKKFTITEKDIRQLPFISDYEPFNWLDLLNGYERARSVPDPLDIALSQHAPFRLEINATIMKILVLPQELIKSFMLSYMPEDWEEGMIEDTIEFLYGRQQQLHDAAIENESFKEFMQSEKAHRQLHLFMEQLTGFVTRGKNKLNIPIGEVRSQFEGLVGATYTVTPLRPPM